MESTMITAMAIILGSVVGAIATFGTTWLTHRTQAARTKTEVTLRDRQALYGEFITEASRLTVDAFTTHLVNYHTPERVRFGFDYTPGGPELLNYLIRQAATPEYSVRWRWTKNSFAIWDNRCTQHYAVQDYWPDVRRMERAGIVGDKTF